ncbi:histidine phosphatase family protein [Rhodopila sp.]|uniref:histidine phosphatase family protein n=1 Tax=Rhodopila sp. TaxID=2480087 RepID=UPI003D0C74DB
MTWVYFITHPEITIEPAVPVTQWNLSPYGRERMRKVLGQPWMRDIGSVWCSDERKAIEAAWIIGDAVGIAPRQSRGLGENDRSATGYLPKAEFEATADAFFSHPNRSVRGWETAADAQARIVAAVSTVLKQTAEDRDIAVISHGGVGTLLLCQLKSRPINRSEDQPGGGGGNYFSFALPARSLCHGWQPIDEIARARDSSRA